MIYIYIYIYTFILNQEQTVRCEVFIWVKVQVLSYNYNCSDMLQRMILNRLPDSSFKYRFLPHDRKIFESIMFFLGNVCKMQRVFCTYTLRINSVYTVEPIFVCICMFLI